MRDLHPGRLRARYRRQTVTLPGAAGESLANSPHPGASSLHLVRCVQSPWGRQLRASVSPVACLGVQPPRRGSQNRRRLIAAEKSWVHSVSEERRRSLGRPDRRRLRRHFYSQAAIPSDVMALSDSEEQTITVHCEPVARPECVSIALAKQAGNVNAKEMRHPTTALWCKMRLVQRSDFEHSTIFLVVDKGEARC